MKQNIIVALFDISSEAYQAFSELKAYSQTTDALVAQAVLIKKENGLIIPAESTDFTANTAESAWTGGLIGSLVGILGGPIGVLLGGAIGALIGSDAGTAQTLGEVSLLEIQPKNWITAVLRSLFWRKNPTKLYWTLSSTVSKPLFSGKMQPLPNRTYWQQ